MSVLCPQKMSEKYFSVSSLALSGAAASGAFAVISALFNILEDFYPYKYVLLFNEVFSACFIISTIYLSVVFFVWAYNVSKSLKAHGIEIETSPLWTVLWFFIPIFNVYKPYKAMRGFWRKISNDKYTIIKVWWAAFIFSGVFSKIAIQAQLNADSLPSLDFARIMYVFSVIANIIYIVVLIKFIRQFSAHFAAICNRDGDAA